MIPWERAIYIDMLLGHIQSMQTLRSREAGAYK